MNEPETWRAWEGRVVEGKYPLKRWLGGSDHSAVFVTEMPSGSPKAIKLIASDADAERRLANWRAAGQLTHPNLIRVFDAGRWQTNGTSVRYVVMELAEEDLSQILPERLLTPWEVGELLPPILHALAYLHTKGFVHGRIKPANVFAIGERVKLSTDQILSLAETTSGFRRRDVYDPPEAAAGIVSTSGDIWSLGMTLVAALTQNVSFAEQTASRDPNPPETIAEPFRGIVRECLHLDPARRCSIAEIEARLRPAGRSVPAPAAQMKPSTKRTRWPVTAAVLGAAVVISLIIFYSGRKSMPPRAAAVSQSAPEPAPTLSQSTPQQSAPQPSTQPPPFQEPAKTPDSPGSVAHQALPDVPASARNTITGTIKVAVRVDVDAEGKVSSAKLSSAGPSQYFANLALKAARQWKFSPPVHDGQTAESSWTLHFYFRRGGTQMSSERLKR